MKAKQTEQQQRKAASRRRVASQHQQTLAAIIARHSVAIEALELEVTRLRMREPARPWWRFW